MIQTANAETATTTMKIRPPDAAYAQTRERAPKPCRDSASGRGGVGDTVKMHPVRARCQPPTSHGLGCYGGDMTANGSRTVMTSPFCSRVRLTGSVVPTS